MLRRFSSVNDWVQEQFFNETKLAPTYTEADLIRPFPFDAYCPESQAPVVYPTTFKLEIAGRVDNKQARILTQLHVLPEASQIACHVCIEGWSAIGP